MPRHHNPQLQVSIQSSVSGVSCASPQPSEIMAVGRRVRNMAGLDLPVQQLEDGESLSCMWTFIVKETGGWFSVPIPLHLSPGSTKRGKSKREMILKAVFWVYSVNRGPEVCVLLGNPRD